MHLNPAEFTLVAFAIALLAGVVGALLGLGGGIIVVPGLTILLGVDIRFAIGASLVAVIATSSGASAAYVRQRMANLRLAMFLEPATVLGALAGGYLAGVIPSGWLYIIFAGVMAYTAVAMWQRNGGKPEIVASEAEQTGWRLGGAYHDASLNRQVEYHVCRGGWGFSISGLAGVVSGLLGVGGGVVQVPVMHLLMGVPLKAATATSNFMIGVTAAASAGVYFTRGNIDPFVAAPVAAGVLIGARTGSRLLGRLDSALLRAAFTAVLVVVAVQMLLKGLR